MKHSEDAQATQSIQVICPVYNEELNIDYFYGRYRAAPRAYPRELSPRVDFY